MTQYRPFRKGTLLMLSGPVGHLHIVMNDPVVFPETGLESILLVNISSWNGSRRCDDTCLIQAGEHPFVRHESYVVYGDSVIKSAEGVGDRVDQGEFTAHQDVSESLYNRVLAGYQVSPKVTPKIRRFIKNYM